MNSGQLATGSLFAGYRIEGLLGSGGMGAVYLAGHPHLPRRVALKVLHTGPAADASVRARFELEADHAARLEHPNIVAVYDRGHVEDRLWISMQYVPGTTAAELLRGGPVRPGRALHIVSEIGRALDHAHRRGVLHRDVKPANILLGPPPSPDEPERVLLADFGIAKALDAATGLTRTGMFVASLEYAAPEQFGDSDIDDRCDIYALGCTFYALLIGRPPYPGRSLAQLWQAHSHGPIPRPSRDRPGIPARLDPVLARALAKTPADRYPICKAFVAAAAEALDIEPSTMPDPTVDAEETRLDSVQTTARRRDEPLRVVLADDSALLRGGITRLLRDEGIEVIGEAGDAPTLLRMVGDHRPAIAVVDIRMPPTHTTEGIDAAMTIRSEYPGTAVLLLSQYVETEHVSGLIAAGTAGLGYLLKDRVSDIDEFVGDLRRVADGGCAIDPSVVSRMVARPHRSRRAVDELSEREREVLALMAEGRSNKAIGAALFLGERTIEAHVRAIFLKLGLHPEADDHRRVLAVLEHLRSANA
ncbi:protein kinase domain-containing protein [Nocardia cyriacigeorgica]|uniref:protein kinase domain-containing protein n=1 Tax=Nocardia cyriacigeorgica TaxID=135487 RepID=UPI002457E417|nr:protein kinase [Nocardia cyriacigeorgica]